MKIYSDTVNKVLERAGWHPERDTFSQLSISKEKKVFPAAKEILSSLGLLKLEFGGADGSQIIYFDVDDSTISKNMRAEMFGCESHDDPSLVNEPDFDATENFKWTLFAEQNLGVSCTRIGFLEDQIGYDIYVVENGNIYLSHGKVPVFSSLNIADFLNSTVLSFL